MSAAEILAPVANDPSLVPGLIERARTELAALKQNIRGKSGPDLFDFIVADVGHMKKLNSDSKNLSAILAGINASAWINEKMREWLGEKNTADIIAQSVPGNVTSEMGLALLDVADVIRPHPKVVEYLQQVTTDDFLDGLAKLDRAAGKPGTPSRRFSTSTG